MSAVHADLRVEVRWIAPMTARNQLLENHSVLIRDGRILDILPTTVALQTYRVAVVLQRPSHMLIPGFVNTHADITTALLAPATGMVRNTVLLAIAEMLKSGVTCFGDRGRSPDETARTAVEQGMRAVIGIPVGTPESLTEALNLRDAYRGHALISTVFAPHGAQALDDDAFSRLIILADEIDAGITIDLHATAAEVADSLHRYGRRPIERLWELGLLTPALNAVHMVHATAADAELARRTGISVSFCPRADLKRGEGLPPIDAFAALDMRLSLGSAGATSASHDLWGDLKLTALMTHAAATLAERSSAWDALFMATRGGAEALGMDADIGTVEAGKWADLCCVDLSGPAARAIHDPVSQLIVGGGIDRVSDVWIAGRHLLSEGALTRLDWQPIELQEMH